MPQYYGSLEMIRIINIDGTSQPIHQKIVKQQPSAQIPQLPRVPTNHHRFQPSTIVSLSSIQAE